MGEGALVSAERQGYDGSKLDGAGTEGGKKG